MEDKNKTTGERAVAMTVINKTNRDTVVKHIKDGVESNPTAALGYDIIKIGAGKDTEAYHAGVSIDFLIEILSFLNKHPREIDKLQDYKAKGFIVLPICDNFDEEGICKGHRFDDIHKEAETSN